MLSKFTKNHNPIHVLNSFLKGKRRGENGAKYLKKYLNRFVPRESELNVGEKLSEYLLYRVKEESECGSFHEDFFGINFVQILDFFTSTCDT